MFLLWGEGCSVSIARTVELWWHRRRQTRSANEIKAHTPLPNIAYALATAITPRLQASANRTSNRTCPTPSPLCTTSGACHSGLVTDVCVRLDSLVGQLPKFSGCFQQNPMNFMQGGSPTLMTCEIRRSRSCSLRFLAVMEDSLRIEWQYLARSSAERAPAFGDRVLRLMNLDGVQQG